MGKKIRRRFNSKDKVTAASTHLIDDKKVSEVSYELASKHIAFKKVLGESA